MLYHEHQEAKGAWLSEREGLVQESAGLVAQREKDQLQLQEFKVLIGVCTYGNWSVMSVLQGDCETVLWQSFTSNLTMGYLYKSDMVLHLALWVT